MKTKVGDYVRICHDGINTSYLKTEARLGEPFRVTKVFKNHIRVWWNPFPTGPLNVRSWVRVGEGKS